MICITVWTNKMPNWKYKAGGAIFSSPAISKNSVVFGSAEGYVHCLNINNGKLTWKYKAGAAVLGSPLINGDTVFIGGSDNSFIALNIKREILSGSFLDWKGRLSALLYCMKTK